MITLNIQVYSIHTIKPKQVQTRRMLFQFLLSNCFQIFFRSRALSKWKLIRSAQQNIQAPKAKETLWKMGRRIIRARIPKFDLNIDDTNERAKLDKEKPMRPEPCTKNCRQLRKLELESWLPHGKSKTICCPLPNNQC